MKNFPIRKYVWELETYDDGTIRRKLATFAGFIGSGVKDKNNREIFEGDRVKFGELGNTGTVAFRNAMFVIDHDHADKSTVLGNTVGFVDVEVIGHITLEDTQ